MQDRTTSAEQQPAAQADSPLPASPVAAGQIAPQSEVRLLARPRVVIVGAGFGGLSAARTLGNSAVDVLIVDRNNYHGFWPLLYQVATAGLEPEAIAYPVRAIVRRYTNIEYRMAEVVGVDFERRQLLTDSAPLPYDYLIIAAGSANNFFGNAALARFTLGMKDIDEAERLRNHMLKMFELASAEMDAAKRQALMTIVIVGGGPTGVELAGAVIELVRHVLRKDFPDMDLSKVRVVLVEGGQQILASFPASLQERAKKRLERMGVDVRLGTVVTSVDSETVTFNDGTTIAVRTVVWAAGVRAADLSDRLGVQQQRGGRVQVTPTLQLPDHPEVYVIGDMAYLEGYKGNQPYPMVAPVAIQQGQQAARNILASWHKRPLRVFRYTDRGQMATIGRRAAVLDAFGIRMSGRLAWFGWLFVHIILLIGFRNRLIVLTNWAFNYFTYERGVRLITRPEC